MPLTANDLHFFASKAPTDTVDGGGPRASTPLQDNAANTLFPDISDTDRLAGRTRLRKVYPSSTNADDAALLGASLAVNEVPTDAAVSLVLMRYGGAVTTRAQLLERLRAWHRLDVPSPPLTVSTGGAGSGPSVVLAAPSGLSFPAPLAGQVIGFRVNAAPDNDPDSYERAIILAVTYNAGSSPTYSLVIDREPTGTYGGSAGKARFGLAAYDELRAYGTAAVPGATASTATAVVTSSVKAQVVPYAGGTYPVTDLGIDPAPFAYSLGKVRMVRGGDIATLWHEEALAAATVAPAQVVNVGRTNLDQLAVVDSTGAEVVRFLAGGPSTGSAITADLAAGTVTFVSISGLAQPVTVRHRIAHRSAVDSVSGNTVNLVTPTSRSFPAGAVISTHVPLGDLQARAWGAFGQQAWTRVWSDALIGAPAPVAYTSAIAVTNQGAEADRWAIVFSSALEFKCYSEALGLVGSGNVAIAFAPLNPATGMPYFTLQPSGWSTEILVGSAFRFNTDGAGPPCWALQCVKPSSPSGTTHAALRVHGSV